MPILFTQNYDIINEKEAAYGEFISRVYIPETTALGLTSIGGYYVEVGFGPRVVSVMSVDGFDDLCRIMITDKFKELTMALKSFVRNYRNAALEPTGRVKREEFTIQKGVWKLNQYYDLRPDVKGRYANFITREFLPEMEKIDYMEVTGGFNVILGGVSDIIAEYTFRDPVAIGHLLNDEDFRKLMLKLRTRYLRSYASRILRCTERFEEPKWFKL